MAKNDGWAEVTLQVFDESNSLESIGFHVIINHIEGAPEIWDTFKTEQEAREEAVRWHSGIWGEGFTYSAEWLRKQAKEY